MADEAVIVVKMEDASGGGSSTAPTTSGAPHTSPPAPTTGTATDYAAKAWKQFEQERQRALIAIEYDKIPKPAFDYAGAAKERFELEQHLSLIQAKYKELYPPAPRNYAAEARERFEQMKEMALVQDEFNKLMPPVPNLFDPTAEAMERRNRSNRRAQVDAEEERLYGKPEQQKSTLDAMIDVGKSLRGTIGGLAGTLVGAALDVASAVSKAQVNTQGMGPQYDGANTNNLTDNSLLNTTPGMTPGTPIATTAAQNLNTTAGQNLNRPSTTPPPAQNNLNTTTPQLTNNSQLPGTLIPTATPTVAVPPPANLPLAGIANTNTNNPPAPPNAPINTPTPAQPGVPVNTWRNALTNPANPLPNINPQPTNTLPTGPPGAGAAATGGGGAMGAAGGIAAALPIVGMVLAAKEAVGAIHKEMMNGVKSGIGMVGGIPQTIASADTDPAVPIAKMGEAASMVGDKLGSLLPGLGIFPVVVGETTKALAGLMQAIDGTARRYGEYSPEIAGTQAIAEVRQTLGDFRRSQEVSGEMAKYLMAQSDLQQKFEDTKARLLTKILPLVTTAVNILELIVPAGEGITNAIGNVASPLLAVAELIGYIVNLMRNEQIPVGKDPAEQLRTDSAFMTPGTGAAGDLGQVPRF